MPLSKPKTAENRALQPGRTVNQAELAFLFGKSLPTLRSWERAGMPVAEKGGSGKSYVYDTAAVFAWFEQHLLSTALGDAKAVDFEEAKRRKMVAEAALVEIELAREQGKLVEIEAVGQAVEAEYSIVRANFLSMPGDMADDLAGLDAAAIEELLATKVAEILGALSADTDYARRAAS